MAVSCTQTELQPKCACTKWPRPGDQWRETPQVQVTAPQFCGASGRDLGIKGLTACPRYRSLNRTAVARRKNGRCRRAQRTTIQLKANVLLGLSIFSEWYLCESWSYLFVMRSTIPRNSARCPSSHASISSRSPTLVQNLLHGAYRG